MKYRYIKNHRSKEIHKANSLFDIKTKRPKFASKSKFKEWCQDPSTDHVFYTMCEGDNPSLRIHNQDNPIHGMHGLVADYDAPVDWDVIDKLIYAQFKEFLPTYRTRTYSNYMRLLWEFEDFCMMPPELQDKFVRTAALEINMENAFPGFDLASYSPSQVFEIGEDWVRIGDPLPKNLYRSWLLKAANNKKLSSSDTSIPMDVIEKQVHEQFPNRWNGPFEVGSRGPLFWIDDGIDREGCAVLEDGILCFSTRGTRGMNTWRDIFGSSFVKQYETKKMSGLLEKYWFNGKSYYTLIHGAAEQIPKEVLELELREMGFSPARKKGQKLSELESAKLRIAQTNRINEIAPVVFSKDRVVTYNSHRILNNANINPVQPAESGDENHWPFLHEWLTQLFSGTETINYFFAWMKRFYEAVLERKFSQGQALILVGSTNKGKSLLSNRVISALVGGFADASDYLSGQTNFNKDLARVAAWVIDDTTSAASFQDQRRATELIKRSVANPRMEYHAKYADAVSIPWTGRVILSLNEDANSLSVIPALDSSNRDKLMALRISKSATSKFPSNDVVESTIAKELPHFAKWLLDWKMPESISGDSRFGVKSYIDTQIESAAYDNSSRSTVAELVEFFVSRARDYYTDPIWIGSLTEFQAGIHFFNNGRNIGVSGSMEFMRRGFVVLEEASKGNKEARPVKSKGKGQGKIWTIDLDEKYDIDKTPMPENVSS